MALDRFLSDPDATLELFDPLGTAREGLSVTWVRVSGPPEPTTAERGGNRSGRLSPPGERLSHATVAMSALAHEPERWEAVLRRVLDR